MDYQLGNGYLLVLNAPRFSLESLAVAVSMALQAWL